MAESHKLWRSHYANCICTCYRNISRTAVRIYYTDFPEMMLNGVQMDEQFFFSSYISTLMFIRKNITSILCRVCSIQDYVLKRVKNKGKNNK